MNSGWQLNKDRAIRLFVQNFERLTRLPLITDTEMELLYGEELSVAVKELERYDHEEKLCFTCVSRCCPMVKCELYSPVLSRCPIWPYRPVLCRMHFCNKFVENYGLLVKNIGDIFLDGLLELEREGNWKAALFDTPPLSGFAPGLVAAVSCCIDSVKEGKLDEKTALDLIYSEAEKFRSV